MDQPTDGNDKAKAAGQGGTAGLPLVALLIGGIIIGLSPIFVRISELGPIASAFWRVALAMLPLLLLRITAAKPTDERPIGLRDAAALALPGLMLAGDLLAWHVSLHITSVANATLIANMAPVFVALGAWLLFQSPVTRGFLTGLAVAIVGVVLLNRGGATAAGTSHLGGDALAIVAAAFYAGYMLSLSKLRARHSTRTIMLWSTASAALCLLPVALLAEDVLFPTSWRGWLVVIGLAWICHLGGQGLVTFAMATLPAAFSSLALLIQPVVAALVAWWLLGELLAPLQIAGGFVVLVGILIAKQQSALDRRRLVAQPPAQP